MNYKKNILFESHAEVVGHCCQKLSNAHKIYFVC